MDAMKAFVSALALIVSTAAFAQQAPSTIPQMPFASTPLSGSELLYVSQGGQPRKTTVGSLSFSAINNLLSSSNLWSGTNTFTGPVTVNGALTATGATNLIQHAATNAALQAIVPTSAGQVYVRDGFYAAGDGGQATYTGSLTNCLTPDNGAQVQPSGTGCWIVATQQRYDARLWGVKADYNYSTGTDNTATLAAAITFSETVQAQGAGAILDLPSGLILAGPQTITGQIRIEGDSAFASTLVLKHGSNAAMLTYSPSGWTFPSTGFPAASTYTNHIRITSQDSASSNATYPNAAGISIVNGNGQELWAYFDYVTIYNMPGDGVDGSVNGGLANWKTLYVQGVGGIGVSLNSVVDWIFDGGPQISESHGTANILLAGVGRVYWHDLNSFAAINGPGMEIVGNSDVIMDGHQEINGNGQGGVVIVGLGLNNVVTIADYNGGFNSQSSYGAYPDIWVYGGSGTVLMSRAVFPAASAVDSNNSTGKNIQYNISYDNSAKVKLFCTDCVFIGGPGNISPQTNQANFIGFNGANSNIGWTVANLPAQPANGLNTKSYVTDATSCSTRFGSLTGGGSGIPSCPVLFQATGTQGLGSATVASVGSGGTTGTFVNLTVTGGTCTTQPVVQGTISGGALTAITGYGTPGSCSVFPTNPATVSGNGLSGATINAVSQPNGSWVQD